MRVIRIRWNEKVVLAAVTDDHQIYELLSDDFISLTRKASSNRISVLAQVEAEMKNQSPLDVKMEKLDLLVPIEAPEVWAAGVTYSKSREARNYESTDGKLDASTFYDKVYDADRPELFMKSTTARTIGPNQAVYLRKDSNWQIPEPELGLVLDEDGTILGYIIGNDMSCRDIEGENPLYLPQAKIWKHSCSIGPSIRLTETIGDPYQLDISLRIYRNHHKVVDESANTSQLKRRFDELVSYLKQDNELFPGTVLLTGTCIVPPHDFTLAEGDRIEIDITGLGTLTNRVEQQ